MIFGRFVNAFAILTAFSSASAPLFAKNTFFLSPLTGAICVIFQIKQRIFMSDYIIHSVKIFTLPVL